MIVLDQIWFGYSADRPVLAGIDLELRPGMNLLLGPNGCGKSTLLKIAAGIEHPERGRVTVAGADLWTDEIAARHSLAYLPEQAQITPFATVSEVLSLVAALRGQPQEAADQALAWAGLGGLGSLSVRELSMGQQRRSLLAALRIGEADYLLLYEPLEGIDRRIRHDLLIWIKKRLCDGATVVVASHQIEPFTELATRLLTLSHGQVEVAEALPDSSDERFTLVEQMARGDKGARGPAGIPYAAR
jgi:ABC-type multidrug transport system ATPase subunit